MVELTSIWIRRKEEAKKRLEICATCDKFDKTTSRCEECGCFMIAKTLWPYSECPLDKWKFYEEQDGE